MAEDEYEKTYLAAGGVVHREKRTARGVFRILSVLSGLLGLVGALALGAGISFGDPSRAIGGMIGAGGLIVFAVVIGLLAITQSVGRAIVTASELTVSFGMRVVRIPLPSISETSLGTFDSSIDDRRAFNCGEIVGPSEHGARYVRIAWSDATGPRVSLVPSDDAETLRAAIDRTRAAASPRVRVAHETSEPAPHEVDAARDARRERR